MKIYNLSNGIGVEHGGKSYVIKNTSWASIVNDDNAIATITSLLNNAEAIDGIDSANILSPLGENQELWACGVTYLRSKVGRQEESKASGGADFYAHVYEAPRPEVFFKSIPSRVVGLGQNVRIRKDSTWDVPEPELTLVVTSSGKIIGYTAGNDMSSRSIEGENPLYLPQAKMYEACAALGPCVYLTNDGMPIDTMIHLAIKRDGEVKVDDKVALSQMKRTPQELVSFVYKEMDFKHGCMIMTGTGIVPTSDFTLMSGDEINITIDHIGTLTNKVA
jgi:2-dehydro-3-deoxy-D-arabinonate dehydratase